MVVKNLGVKLDSLLSIKPQITAVGSSCFRLLHALKMFLCLLPLSARKIVIHGLFTSRLDYTNSLYLGLSKYLFKRLQVVQNVAACIMLRLP